MKSLDAARSYFEDVHKSWGWLLGVALALMALGYIAIRVTSLITLTAFSALGVVLIVGGLFELIDAFRTRKWGGSKMNFFVGLLTIALGILLLVRPVFGARSVTLFVGIFLIAVGLLRVFYVLAIRFQQWGWFLASGIVGAVLGVVILLHWPDASRSMVGLFVGVDLMFFGWATLMLAIAVHRLPEDTSRSTAHA
jgi:uncharacterized membrane protein HdeD (DUF308 family)